MSAYRRAASRIGQGGAAALMAAAAFSAGIAFAAPPVEGTRLPLQKPAPTASPATRLGASTTRDLASSLFLEDDPLFTEQLSLDGDRRLTRSAAERALLGLLAQEQALLARYGAEHPDICAVRGRLAVVRDLLERPSAMPAEGPEEPPGRMKGGWQAEESEPLPEVFGEFTPAGCWVPVGPLHPVFFQPVAERPANLPQPREQATNSGEPATIFCQPLAAEPLALPVSFEANSAVAPVLPATSDSEPEQPTIRSAEPAATVCQPPAAEPSEPQGSFEAKNVVVSNPLVTGHIEPEQPLLLAPIPELGTEADRSLRMPSGIMWYWAGMMITVLAALILHLAALLYLFRRFGRPAAVAVPTQAMAPAALLTAARTGAPPDPDEDAVAAVESAAVAALGLGLTYAKDRQSIEEVARRQEEALMRQVFADNLRLQAQLAGM